MRIILLLSLMLLTGCASTEPTVKIKFDSKPQGAEVFEKSESPGILWLPKLSVRRIGVTPCTWQLPRHDIQWTFEAVMVMSDQTLLRGVERKVFKRRGIYDPNVTLPKGKDGAYIIFFDFTKP